MGLALGSADGRWLVAASVLGSGLAFLASTAVNVALPAIGRELGGGLGVQQWVLDGYLLTLSALLSSPFFPCWPGSAAPVGG